MQQVAIVKWSLIDRDGRMVWREGASGVGHIDWIGNSSSPHVLFDAPPIWSPLAGFRSS